MKIQRVDGITVYDSFELSVNTIDKTGILKLNDVNIVQATINNAVAANVYSRSEIDISLNPTSNTLTTYLKTDVNVALSSLQAGIDNRVLSNDVAINRKFKINAVSTDILKKQRVDGTIVYDLFELSFNPIDKTSILKT